MPLRPFHPQLPFRHLRSRSHVARPFHSSLPRPAQPQSAPNHYDTLQLSSSATAQEIKRQFFNLSKLHHPDKNPNDPTATTRFVQISEAYHTLGVPEKRLQYDRELHSSRHSHHHHGTAHPQGSYSSASFAGSRPATGLNKKRGTFRGPPPSFYKSGGYGKHEAKRTEYAYQNAPGAAPGAGMGAESEDGHRHGGYGPGQTSHGHSVPHFNDVRHKQMHDSVNEYIFARRRARTKTPLGEGWDGGDLIFNFMLVGGGLAFIIWSITLFGEDGQKVHEKKFKEKRDGP